MPDINLDSLFIVGLILASLLGKIFKKKEPAEKEKPIQKEESSDSLEDVLKEAWQKVTNPREEFSEAPPPLDYDSELQESTVTTEEVTDTVPIPAVIDTMVQTAVKDSDLKGFWDTSKKKRKFTSGKKLQGNAFFQIIVKACFCS